MPPTNLITRQVRLAEITIPPGRRPATPAGVKMMIDSILEIGLGHGRI